MHAVLARPQIHRTDGQPLHDPLDLIQGEPVHATRIAVAEGAGEIAFVGESEPERDTGIRRRPCRMLSTKTELGRCSCDHSPYLGRATRRVVRVSGRWPANSGGCPSFRSSSKIRSYSASREICGRESNRDDPYTALGNHLKPRFFRHCEQLIRSEKPYPATIERLTPQLAVRLRSADSKSPAWMSL